MTKFNVFNVVYKFILGQEVRTPYAVGIVRMLGYNDEGVQYYVVTEHMQSWFKEQQLTPIEQEEPIKER